MCFGALFVTAAPQRRDAEVNYSSAQIATHSNYNLHIQRLVLVLSLHHVIMKRCRKKQEKYKNSLENQRLHVGSLLN